jgi:hypothetical protein
MTIDTQTAGKLFATEADQNPQFAKETSVLPRGEETQESLRSALTNEHWILLSGDKGSGKTSYLFLGLRDIPRKMLGVYAPFETIGPKSEIKNSQDENDFLCKHFYGGLISRLDTKIKGDLSGKAKESQSFLQDMIDALMPVEVEQTRTLKKKKGFLARLGIKNQPVDLGVSYGKSIEELVIERRKIPARPNYEKFRQTLKDLIKFLGYEAVVFYVDEVNEIRLAPSAVACLFEHIYKAYKTYKSTVCFKIAITDTVEENVPDEIISGNYFEPKNLKSFLLHPKEYEDFIHEILRTRMKQLGIGLNLEDIFSESGLHTLVMASMGNPRDFFLAARQTWETQQKKIDKVLALERAKQIGGRMENRIMEEGGVPKVTYEKLVESLKERSRMKKGDSSSPTGVSYFMIAEAEKLSPEAREALSRLEREKIVYSTRSYRALRRRGQKSEMMVISYPICVLKSIRYLDVAKTMEQTGQTENQIISQHRAQIQLQP